MGQIPPAKMFNNPTAFGSSPNPNVLTQTQNAVQIPTAGVGFANTNQTDTGITQATPQPAADPNGGAQGNPFLMRKPIISRPNVGMLQS